MGLKFLILMTQWLWASIISVFFFSLFNLAPTLYKVHKQVKSGSRWRQNMMMCFCPHRALVPSWAWLIDEEREETDH